MASLGQVGDRSYWHYEKGERAPDADFLVSIQEAGADVLYILTGRRQESELSHDESALLTGYRAMDARGRAMVLAMIGGYTQPAAPSLTISGATIGQVVQGDAAGGGQVVSGPETGSQKNAGSAARARAIQIGQLVMGDVWYCDFFTKMQAA